MEDKRKKIRVPIDLYHEVTMTPKKDDKYENWEEGLDDDLEDSDEQYEADCDGDWYYGPAHPKSFLHYDNLRLHDELDSLKLKFRIFKYLTVIGFITFYLALALMFELYIRV